MNIKELETQTGISSQNIRFYEKKGLLHPIRNQDNNYRNFSAEDVRTLQLIKILRRLDVPIGDIHRILNGDITLNAAMESQLQRLCQQKSCLDAAIKMCQQLLHTDAEHLDVSKVLLEMDKIEKEGGFFMSIIRDYKKMAKAQSQKTFSFMPDNMVLNAAEFTESLCKYAEDHHLDLNITKEGMYPIFTLDGTEYTASRHQGRFGAVIRCTMTHPELAENKEAPDVPLQRRKLLGIAVRLAFPVCLLLVVFLFLFITRQSFLPAVFVFVMLIPFAIWSFGYYSHLRD